MTNALETMLKHTARAKEHGYTLVVDAGQVEAALEDARRQGAKEMRGAIRAELHRLEMGAWDSATTVANAHWAHAFIAAQKAIAALPLPGNKEANDDA